MFLIEYQSYTYVNAEDIVYLRLAQDGIGFCLKGEETYYSVECGFEDKFLNHLQALNNNTDNIESKWREYNG